MAESLFFDLDGTLSDPKEGITRCIQHAISTLGLDVPAVDDLEWCIGPPLRPSLETLVGTESAEKALAFYRDRFSQIGWRENLLYPKIKDVLSRANALGHDIYVVTSKPKVFADKIVHHFGIDSEFKAVFGSELDGTRSDKSRLLEYALEKTGASDRSWMIGDRRFDIEGAKANRLRSVGVLYGYGSKAELETAGADAFAHAPDDVLNCVD